MKNKLLNPHEQLGFSRESGFTLVELLMVSFLLSILGVSILQVITQIQAASQTAEEKRTVMEQNFRAFSIIRSQLLALGSSPLPSMQSSMTPGSAQSSFSGRAFGTNRSFEVLENMDGGVLLRFVTKGTLYANPLQRQLYGEIEVRYYVDASVEERPLVMEFWDISPVRITRESQEPLRRSVILNNIQDFRVRSHTNLNWNTNWDNPYAPKPTLIELSLIRMTESGNPETFRAAVPVYSTY
jgi:prepilin-type N-terminal cleavage/methylation domain-containing protein